MSQPINNTLASVERRDVGNRAYLAAIDQAESQSAGLGAYIRHLFIERRLSLRDVEMRAGGKISDSHLANILSGDFGSLRISTLKALARGLGIGEERLFIVASGQCAEYDLPFQESDFFVLFDKYTCLAEEEQKEVALLLEVLLREIERMPHQIHIDKSTSQARQIELIDTKDTLKTYLRRALKQKGLTFQKVELRSGGKISSSHVNELARGETGNPTVAKIKGLAEGLGVPVMEIFDLFCGRTLPQDAAFQHSFIGELWSKYDHLVEADQRQLTPMLKVIDRELDWRHMHRIRTLRQSDPKTLV